MKELALKAVDRMEERLLQALHEPSVELIFLYDADDDGTAETQRSYCFSPADGLSVQFTFWPQSMEQWLTPLFVGFLALLRGFFFGQIFAEGESGQGKRLTSSCYSSCSSGWGYSSSSAMDPGSGP